MMAAAERRIIDLTIAISAVWQLSCKQEEELLLMKHRLSLFALCSLLVFCLLRILAMTSLPLSEKLSLVEMKTNITMNTSHFIY
jgi:hypothetical protein